MSRLDSESPRFSAKPLSRKPQTHILCHIPESVELDLSTEGVWTGSGVSRLDSESPRFSAKPLSCKPQTHILCHIPESVELDLSTEGVWTGSGVSRLDSESPRFSAKPLSRKPQTHMGTFFLSSPFWLHHKPFRVQLFPKN